MTKPTGREERLARLTPEQRAAFEARVRGGAAAAGATARSREDAAAAGGTIAPAPRPAPLSFGQERLWFLEQLTPRLGVYNEYVALRLTGSLDVAALDGALGDLFVRHEALRTVVDSTGGTPTQRVLPPPDSVLRVVDLPRGEGGTPGAVCSDGTMGAAERDLAEKEAARPFAVAEEILFRALLIRSAPDRALLVVVNHHMVGDAWSRAVLVEDLCAGYRARVGRGVRTAEKPLPVQYGDWAAWQRSELSDENLAEDLRYWRERLTGAPPRLDLATDRQRPASSSHRGGRVRFTLDPRLTEAVEATARTARATPFAVTLAAWQAVLMRHSGQHDVVVGVPTAGRDRPETAGLVGMFVNTLVLRTDLSRDMGFGDLIAQVRETTLTAMDHGRVPFERLVRELSPSRDLSHAPLYQVQFGHRTAPEGVFSLPGLQVETVDMDNGLCRVDLSLELVRRGDLTEGICEYSRDLFDEAGVRSLTDALERVLRRGATDPGLPVSELLVLTPAERAQLDAAGDGGPLPPDAADVIVAFSRVARDRPGAQAVVSGGSSVTYRELHDRAISLAGRLRAAGVRPGDRVGIGLRRGQDVPAALLAVLMAEAAYLPLDPDHPRERLRFVCADASPAAVLVHSATREAFAAAGVVPDGAVLIDLDVPEAEVPVADVTVLDADPEAPAYVIHTSGSTGRPKGVVVLRRNLTAFLAAMDDVVETGGDPLTWLAVTGISFDISVLELLWTLSRGHRVIVSPDTAPVGAAEGPRESGARFSLFYFASASSDAAPGPDRYRLLIEGARFGDEHGFRAVWLPERHFHDFGGPFPAPSVLAAAVAAATLRIGIRAGSVVMPLHHPVRVAEEWAVVDNLSNGRVGLSFASGWHIDDFVLARDAYADRPARTLRGLDEVRRLWRGERVSFPGVGDRTVEVGVLPRPVQPELPAWLTSSGNPETCRRAGEVGAGLLTHLLGQSVDDLAERIALYRAAWRGAGHAGEPHVTLMLHAFVGADAGEVRAHAWQPFRDYLRSSVGLIENMARSSGVDLTADDFTEDDREALLDHACARYLADSSLIGTVEDRLPLVHRLHEIGVDEIACLVDFGVPTDVAIRALSGLAALASAAATVPPAAHPPAPEDTLTGLIRAHGVTHLQCTPSQMRALLDEPDVAALGGLRQLLLGGEPLDTGLVGRLAPHVRGSIRNMYGPTETTVWSTTDAVEPAEGIVTIGRPIAGTTVRVLDPHGRRVPVGVPGELCIGGAGVTAGYLNQPELTAERYVTAVGTQGTADTAEPSSRAYRTGDIVRVRRDGRIDYLSRNDDQLKIRGFRVEAGEVEAALADLPGVRRCAVAGHGLGRSQATLVAYVVPEQPDRPPVASELRARLAHTLPPFLVPSRFVVLDALPLTTNGKLDRGALPAPGPERTERGAYVAPRTATEQGIAAVWREALDADRVGVHDDFFDLGGHSLLATQVVAGIRRSLGVELPLRTLFRAPTVAALADAVDELGGPAHAAPSAAELWPDPEHRYESFPLTDVQRAYWIGRSGAVGGGVSCHLYVELDVDDVDLPRLECAWAALVRRHDALRIVIDPEGRQRILAEVPEYRIEVDDLRALDDAERTRRLQATREELSHQVLPSDTWPLFRIRSSRTGGTGARLHIGVDTLIADGGSVQILLHELLAVYRGELDPQPLALSFRDYVLAEQDRRRGPQRERDLAYWRDRLDSLPPAPPLPLVRRFDELPATRFVRREARLPTDVWARLKRRAAAARITPSALALSAYATVLGAWSGSDRFTLNLTLFNRVGDHPDLPMLVGDFTALTMLEVVGATTGAFADRARGIQDRLWEDLDHRLVSGVWVAGELARRRGVADAVMPVVFTSELGAPDAGGTPPGDIDARVAHAITQTPQVWLDHQIAEDRGELRLTWDAVDDLFPPGMLDDVFGAYTGLLASLADEPAAWDDSHREVLPPEQTARYATLNDTGGTVPEGLLHEPFLDRARREPWRTAVVSATGAVTYGELERASRLVGRALLHTGVRPGDVVGVLANRGWEQVASAVGALRAGAAYLPLDGELPAARMASSLAHAGAVALVVPSVPVDGSVPARVTVVPFADAIAPGDDGAVEFPATVPGDLAYVIYTSGSTGEPKGVMIDHRGALNTVVDVNGRFALAADDRVFGLSSLGFDLSVYDVFGTLAAGATLVLPGPGEERDPVRWARLVADHGVTVWNSVPALMEMLLLHACGNPAADLATLRLVMLSGDWIPVDMPDRIREVAPKAQVIGLGGATEASIWSVLHPVDTADRGRPSIPYGRPMRNQRVYVLDEGCRLRPTGLPGALYIGGVGLAVGYRNAPDLTARAFPTHPGTGERLYRTGDRARLLPDGDLEFLGREDAQVKIRGMRIEPGEIEAALVRADGVREAAVVVAGSGMSAQLAAYVVRDVPDRAAPTPGARTSLDADRVRRLETRLRQPGRRDDLAGREILPFVPPADARALRSAAAAQGSATGFAPGPVPAGRLFALLTVLARQDDDAVPRYAYASAGGLYAVQTYVAVAPGGVDGVPAGIHYLDPAGPALVVLDGADGARRVLDPLLVDETNRGLAEQAGFAAFLVSRPAAIVSVYGELAERFVLLEAGAMAQLLRQRAADCGVGLCPIGDVHQDLLRDVLGLEADQAVVHSLVGGLPLGGSDDPETWSTGLRARLAERLPAYMVPQRVHVIEALPLTANGKVDRKALAGSPVRSGPAAPPPAAAHRAPDPGVPVASSTNAVATATTERLAALWREVMDGQELGIDVNFFDSGATSIHLVRLQRRIAEELGTEVSVVELFDHPTIRHLAELLDDGEPATAAEPDVGTATAAADRRRHHQRRRAARRRGSEAASAD